MDDNEFYVDSVTIQLFRKENPPEELFKKLEGMLQVSDPVEIVWQKEITHNQAL